MFHQTHFETTMSPAHMGDQSFMHRDVHHHLAFPDGSLVRGGPVSQDNHRPIDLLPQGQTMLPAFELTRLPGIH